MLNKVFAGFVVVFWAAMMAALVRVEIFPKPTVLESYPTERVLQKIFSNPTPARLNIYRRAAYGEPIGFCKIEIRPKRTGEWVEELTPSQPPDAYEVKSKLNIRLSVFGMPSQVWVSGKSTFNQNLGLKDFDMTTRISGGLGRIRVTGDDTTKTITVVSDVGDVHDERTFGFDQVQDTGFASAFGLPGLANFNFAGNGGALNSSSVQPVTTTHFDRLEIAGSPQRVYLITSKINEQVWTKIWVSESDGEVLKVSTSLGLEMVSDALKVGMDQ